MRTEPLPANFDCLIVALFSFEKLDLLVDAVEFAGTLGVATSV